MGRELTHRTTRGAILLQWLQEQGLEAPEPAISESTSSPLHAAADAAEEHVAHEGETAETWLQWHQRYMRRTRRLLAKYPGHRWSTIMLTQVWRRWGYHEESHGRITDWWRAQQRDETSTAFAARPDVTHYSRLRN